MKKAPGIFDTGRFCFVSRYAPKKGKTQTADEEMGDGKLSPAGKREEEGAI